MISHARFLALLGLCFAAFFYANALSAQNFSSDNFTVTAPVIFPGGYSTSDNFRLTGVVSQMAIGTSTAATFDVYSGFLYFSDVTSAAVPAADGSAGAGPLKFLDVFPPVPTCPLPRVDFNSDCKVDIVELSILLFHWERIGPEIASYDLNGSGQIDLVDISILFYHWTG